MTFPDRVLGHQSFDPVRTIVKKHSGRYTRTSWHVRSRKSPRWMNFKLVSTFSWPEATRRWLRHAN